MLQPSLVIRRVGQKQDITSASVTLALPILRSGTTQQRFCVTSEVCMGSKNSCFTPLRLSDPQPSAARGFTWHRPGTGLAPTDGLKCILFIFKSHVAQNFIQTKQPCPSNHQASESSFFSSVSCMPDRPIRRYFTLELYSQAIQLCQTEMHGKQCVQNQLLYSFIDSKGCICKIRFKQITAMWKSAPKCQKTAPEQSDSNLLHMDFYLFSFFVSDQSDCY